MSSVRPFVPVSVTSQDPSHGSSEGFKRGFAEGLALARAEALVEVTQDLRAELNTAVKERDAALARAAGADAEFELQKHKVAEITSDLAHAVTALNEAARTWREREATALEGVQREALSFAIDVAESIGLSLPDADRLKAALESCVGLLGFSDPIRLRVHPSCANALSMLPDGWDASLVTLITDPAVAPGEVLCEQGETQLRAGLDASLSRIRDTLGVQQTV
jgi:flagellar biosynthesis/type III secretory pathway protein FliH